MLIGETESVGQAANLTNRAKYGDHSLASAVCVTAEKSRGTTATANTRRRVLVTQAKRRLGKVGGSGGELFEYGGLLCRLR